MGTIVQQPTQYGITRRPLPTQTIDGKEYEWGPTENTKANDGLFKHVHSFLGSANGAYRFAQVSGKVLTTAAETSRLAGCPEMAKSLKDTGKVFNTVAGGMILPYWAWVSCEVKEQVEKVNEKGGTFGNIVELVRRCLDWTTSACYSLALFIPGVKVLTHIAKGTDFTVDTIEAGQAANNWMKADAMQNQSGISEDVQADLARIKTLSLVGGMSKTITVAAHILGILGLILGAALVPPLVMMVLGLITCSGAIFKHFLAASMVCNPLDKGTLSPPYVIRNENGAHY